MRRTLLVLVCATMVGSAGCGGSDDDEADAPGSTPKVLTPAAYDCTASEVPAKASPVAVSCSMSADCRKPSFSAHRGAGSPTELAPEDSLSAFRAAIASGADFTECDVRVTSDGVAVVIHDDGLDRTTDASGNVSELTLDTVKTAALKADGLPGDFSCERVPTFDDVLKLTKGRIVLIVDGTKIDSAQPIVKAIAQADAFDSVIFDHTDEDQLEAALQLDDRLAYALRASSADQLTTRLARFGKRKPAYIHIGLADPAVMSVPVHEAGYPVLALGFVTDVAAAGGDRQAYEKLYAKGVDIIQSNRPDLLGVHLKRIAPEP